MLIWFFLFALSHTRIHPTTVYVWLSLYTSFGCALLTSHRFILSPLLVMSQYLPCLFTRYSPFCGFRSQHILTHLGPLPPVEQRPLITFLHTFHISFINVFSGVTCPNAFDQLKNASMQGGFTATPRTNPPAASIYLTSGTGPYVGFFYAIEVRCETIGLWVLVKYWEDILIHMHILRRHNVFMPSSFLVKVGGFAR